MRAPSVVRQSEEVDYLREFAIKKSSRSLNWFSQRKSTQVMVVADGSGAMHRLSLHAEVRQPRCKKEPKWPSKVSRQRMRMRERDDKVLGF
jgi:hypothetical protein